MSAALQEILAGPWEFHEQGDANEYCLLTCAGKWVIAFRINGEIMTADEIAIAKMIAAAPDMLAALKNLQADLREAIARAEVPTLTPLWDAELKAADAAIAKAEGKTEDSGVADNGQADPESDIASRFKRLVVASLSSRGKTKAVANHASFFDDLGADSLDVIELLMATEEEFGIEIADADAERMLTVGDVIRYLEKVVAS